MSNLFSMGDFGPDQALRFKKSLTASGMWVVCTAILVVFFIQGVMRLDLTGCLGLMSLVLLGLLGFLVSFLISRELIIWLSFSLASSCLCWMGNEVSQLRTRLKAGNTELVSAMNQIHNLAVTDELTGTFNRRYIMDELDRLKKRTDKEGIPSSICYMDIDHF